MFGRHGILYKLCYRGSSSTRFYVVLAAALFLLFFWALSRQSTQSDVDSSRSLLLPAPPRTAKRDAGEKYLPSWESIDSRPLPDWFDDAKIGIFIHWGVYSVPSFGDEWFLWRWRGERKPGHVQFMAKNYPSNFSYPEFAPRFTAEFFEPDHWADLFKAAGARYVVLTSKHHEGFANWPSAVSKDWNAVDVGPKRDLVGDLAKSIRSRTDIRFGLYYSLYEWFNPLYMADKAAKFQTNSFIQAKVRPELFDIVNTYKPEIVWSDGDWEAPDTYWNSTHFLAWLYNDSPVKETVVTNDRWGKGDVCHHGGYYTCNDRYNPGSAQKHKWENCMTIDRRSWGFRRNAAYTDYMSAHDLITQVVSTVSCGGNILINVGPEVNGMISAIFEDRLLALGAWLRVNGEAIYSSRPCLHQQDMLTKTVWYTCKESKSGVSAYAISLNWPTKGQLILGSVVTTSRTTVQLLGYRPKLEFSRGTGDNGIEITVPAIHHDEMPCLWAWVFKLDSVAMIPSAASGSKL